MTSPTLPDMTVIEDRDSAPFWQALRRGSLELPYCEECERAFWYPRQFCPACLGDRVSWRAVSGDGQVYSWTALPQRDPARGSRVIALVDLAEGPRLMMEVIGADRTRTRVGDPVQLAIGPDAAVAAEQPPRPYVRRRADDTR